MVEDLLEHTPVVKLVYTSLKDMVGAFVGEEKKFDRPVMVALTKDSDITTFGFVTRGDLGSLGLEGSRRGLRPSGVQHRRKRHRRARESRETARFRADQGDDVHRLRRGHRRSRPGLTSISLTPLGCGRTSNPGDACSGLLTRSRLHARRRRRRGGRASSSPGTSTPTAAPTSSSGREGVAAFGPSRRRRGRHRGVSARSIFGGALTALAAGDVNRPDGLTDLVAAVETDSGPALLVFESPAGPLMARPRDDRPAGGGRALAIGSVRRRVPVRHRRGAAARSSSRSKAATAGFTRPDRSWIRLESRARRSTAARSRLAAGRWIAPEDGRLDLAVLSQAGVVSRAPAGSTRRRASSSRGGRRRLPGPGAGSRGRRPTGGRGDNLVVSDPGTGRVLVFRRRHERHPPG